MSKKVRVTPKDDGAIISVDGYDITITVTPSLAFPEEVPSLPVSLRITLDSVRLRLLEYLEELEISEKTEEIVVRPKGFLGRGTFASVAAVIKDLGGHYISAGKESRFVIAKTS